MSRYWVVAADASYARIFARDKKFSPLVEVETLAHPESRLHRQDLASDKPGRLFESYASSRSEAEEPTDPKVREAQAFARQVAETLEVGRNQGKFQELIIVADPKFLGLLRKALDAETRGKVVHAVDKNLARESVEVITHTVDEML
ncbi:host attachment protein [Alkalilimnicola ehrlichii MLHE-1]|uniref:Host attachment protein n=1 Tax=Alkalilimnicola ehrlichii (strain ATCC BAA-1101 / DSM 17681 / MLHE-1) TaxID=187272 RepID=Q0AAV6_ALKEH|nr:host attachment protein [Alkalilimnicola ehrlichii]ABI56031.1 conserved hypothetical protein [Alkalilimnicola ehrlichii MLHE-1]